MFLLFFLFWVILNGKITVEIALIGLVLSCAVFLFICFFGEHTIKKELTVYRNIPLAAAYAAVLIKEIFAANIKTAKLIFSKKTSEAVVKTVDVPLKSKAARTAYADSITITPGTVTVNMTDSGFTVHCLDKSFAEGLGEGTLLRLLMKMEKSL